MYLNNRLVPDDISDVLKWAKAIQAMGKILQFLLWDAEDKQDRLVILENHAESFGEIIEDYGKFIEQFFEDASGDLQLFLLRSSEKYEKPLNERLVSDLNEVKRFPQREGSLALLNENLDEIEKVLDEARDLAEMRDRYIVVKGLVEQGPRIGSVGQSG